MSKIVKKRKYRSYRPLLVAAIIIALAIIIITTILYTTQHPSVNVDMDKYFSDIISTVNLGPYVPTVIAIGSDGNPIAIVQGEYKDADFWHSVLNSKFNGTLLVVSSTNTIKVTDRSVISKINATVKSLCSYLERSQGLESLRSIAVMYAISTCPHCKAQEEFFESNDIGYIAIELDTKNIIKRIPLSTSL